MRSIVPCVAPDLLAAAAAALLTTGRSADCHALARVVRGSSKYRGVSCTIAFDPATGHRLNDPTAFARCGSRA
jgi:ABC-type branched-subunit amino acid transport system substrate-binding protein